MLWATYVKIRVFVLQGGLTVSHSLRVETELDQVASLLFHVFPTQKKGKKKVVRTISPLSGKWRRWER